MLFRSDCGAAAMERTLIFLERASGSITIYTRLWEFFLLGFAIRGDRRLKMWKYGSRAGSAPIPPPNLRATCEFCPEPLQGSSLG